MPRLLAWLGAVIGLVVLTVVAAFVIAWIGTTPMPLPAGSENASRLAWGPNPVGLDGHVWVDPTRPTEGHGEAGRASDRTFAVDLWYPEGLDGRHPLVVYSHGFMSTRAGGRFLARHLASHGYIVLAADYPLSHADAPGGPEVLDVVHQPADVSFLIDRLLGLGEKDRPFEGEVDEERIGVFGLSLGGLTSTLVAFDPEARDARVAAAISIAGPADVFGPAYFDHADVPFLMIGGTADSIVAYEDNAAPIPDRIRDGGLVTIHGGTHLGFDDFAAGPMRVFGNPDELICGFALADAERERTDTTKNVFLGLFGGAEQGLLQPAEYRPGCSRIESDVLEAGRQQMLTTLAVHAFFESHFAAEATTRADHADFLARRMPMELDEVSYQGSRR